MAKIDAHQHFWKFNPVRDSWITDEMSVIQRDFLPPDLQPLLRENDFDGCVVVQSDETEQENIFQLDNAAQNGFIKGVVGWVDLQANNVEERLAYYSSLPKMKGFRHVLQGEANSALMLQPNFMNGISKLAKHDFTYDILIFSDQLKYIPQFVSSFPAQKFVIDHIAKPLIKEGKTDEWKKEIQAVANYENVWCKISGLVTEADWKLWKVDDFTPYLDVVTKAFGTKRIMYGSDWPVCLVAASYSQMLSIVKDYFSGFSDDEQDAFFGGNASKFYNLRHFP
ncbi:MAG: L-fuconolactone hydrolase [uncultured Segetibacter sp.]|uniref:L-fuconolactone hydrolase n=1 Tax=uncultured Segetibacter sp. TaxID=481133 RepID=A0A6J4TM14_9BACT|nr:MAG: L-fuconolactone hydrolase [uncultured Segetibacter sp.]